MHVSGCMVAHVGVLACVLMCVRVRAMEATMGLCGCSFLLIVCACMRGACRRASARVCVVPVFVCFLHVLSVSIHTCACLRVLCASHVPVCACGGSQHL